MDENFPSLGKEIDVWVQEAERVTNKMIPKRSTPRHIIIKMTKVKDNERILKAVREKQRVAYKEISIRLLAGFSVETLSDTFKVLKGKISTPKYSTQQE